MIMEHNFLVRLDAPETMAVITALLADFGFAEAPATDLVEHPQAFRAFIRGSPPAGVAGFLVRPEQRVAVAFDRGRVMVASSIALATRRSGMLTLRRVEPAEVRRTEKLLTVTVLSVEAVLRGAALQPILDRWRYILNDDTTGADRNPPRSMTMMALGAICIISLLLMMAAIWYAIIG